MNNQNILIISTSLSAASRSRIAAQYATSLCEQKDSLTVDWIDLSEHPLQPYPLETSKTLEDLKERMKNADGLILAFPIHNWDASDQTRTFLAYTLDKKHMRNLPCLLLAGCSTKASFMVPPGVGTTLQAEINAIMIGSGVMACGDDVNRETGDIVDTLKERITKNVELLIKVSANDLVERQTT